jgi:hypothetical protein
MSMSARGVPVIGFRNETRVFTLAEARELFPVVRRATTQSRAALEPVKARLAHTLASDPRFAQAEAEYRAIVKAWVAKMERLGLVARGLWVVDFDTGDGYLCWRFPELRIAHWHGYDTGVAGRRPLHEVVAEFVPDWA